MKVPHTIIDDVERIDNNRLPRNYHELNDHERGKTKAKGECMDNEMIECG